MTSSVRAKAPQLTYDQMCAKLGIGRCGLDPQDCPIDHYPGVVVRYQGSLIAHWSDRRINRRGAFNFIRHVEIARVPPGSPKWMVTWLSTSRAVDKAAELGYRIPRWYTETERRRVRWLLRDPATREHNEDARRAWKWAQPE